MYEWHFHETKVRHINNATQHNSASFLDFSESDWIIRTMPKCILILGNDEREWQNVWCMDLMVNFVFAINAAYIDCYENHFEYPFVHIEKSLAEQFKRQTNG